MSEVATVENAAMERQEAMDTRPQDRYAGRGKFTGCRECGSDFGMHSICRGAMAEFLPGAIERFAPWYRDGDTDLILYCRCWTCNFDGWHDIPDDWEQLGIDEVLAWLNADPMLPNYTILASEPEAATATLDSRAAAGLER